MSRVLIKKCNIFEVFRTSNDPIIDLHINMNELIKLIFNDGRQPGSRKRF